MIGRSSITRTLWGAVTAAACLFAAWVVVDTLRTVVPLHSSLPWMDEWATLDLIRAWQGGDLTAWQVLFAQHNEHRILLPRLVFFADDALFNGQGWLSLAGIFLVQALHAAMFIAVLARAPRKPGSWAVGALIVALMFSLRQAENFSSGFQIQFVAVFAGATLSFLLFGLATARAREGRPIAAPLGWSFASVLATSLTMANGLVAGFVLVVLALAGRVRPRVVLACAAWVVALALVYFHGYEPVGHHSRPSDSLRHPVAVLLYVAAYLGGAASTAAIGTAEAWGSAGLALTAVAAVRILRRQPRPASLAMFGVMLFVGAGAVVTASGRLELGTLQALSSRYATGSIAFWAAHLTYWWTDPPALPVRFGRGPASPGSAARGAVAVVGAVLVAAMSREQGEAKPPLYVQNFAQRQSADLILLGLHDPADMVRSAWSRAEVEDSTPLLKRYGLSIFATPEAGGVGRPVTERGTLLSPDPCGGGVGAAVADPSLGRGGVRVSGLAWNGPARRPVRRILLADADGMLVGFGSGGVPRAGQTEWRGYAVAPPGASLIAYGLLGGDRLCRVGGPATVAEPASHQASQPDAAP